MIPCAILGTGSLLPGRRVSTQALAEEVRPGRDPAELVARTGIRERFWADPHIPLARLAADALGQALDAAGMAATELDRVILANCTGAEWRFPAPSNALCAELGLKGSCAAVTINNACMGFVTALDMAARFVATGTGPVGVVAAELCSRHIHATEPRPYLVFGDGVGAAVVGPARGGSGVVASHLANDGTLGGAAVLSNPFALQESEPIRFEKSNAEMTHLAVSALVKGTRAALAGAGLTLGDVAWVLPHQPNGSMFDTMVAALGVDAARTVRIVEEVGSVGSASIAISLDRLLRSGRVAPGDRLLLVGVGSGVAWGALVYQVGEAP